MQAHTFKNSGIRLPNWKKPRLHVATRTGRNPAFGYAGQCPCSQSLAQPFHSNTRRAHGQISANYCPSAVQPASQASHRLVFGAQRTCACFHCIAIRCLASSNAEFTNSPQRRCLPQCAARRRRQHGNTVRRCRWQPCEILLRHQMWLTTVTSVIEHPFLQAQAGSQSFARRWPAGDR